MGRPFSHFVEGGTTGVWRLWAASYTALRLDIEHERHVFRLT
jgi:hypothetical protein